MNDTIYVGLDVHKATVAVAVAEGMRVGEVRQLGSIRHTPEQIAKLAENLAKGGRRLSFCYEAGPCGYGLHRQLIDLGHDCIVVAPSLIPVKPGDRVKTDRRDAVMLAKLHRSGDLTAVWVPDSAHEAVRDHSPLRLAPAPIGPAPRFKHWGANAPDTIMRRACPDPEENHGTGKSTHLPLPRA